MLIQFTQNQITAKSTPMINLIKNNAALFSNLYGGYLADIRPNGENDVVYNIVR